MRGQANSRESLSRLEVALLKKALAGDNPVLATLRKQATVACVDHREYSGVGFFTYLDFPAETQGLDTAPTFRISDVSADIDGLQNGAGFVVLIEDGYLAILEGFSFDEPWPDEIQRFSMFHDEDPRELDFLR